ncbi:MAG TPA: site-2 protease family protein [Isosphaeraceae bacterium]|jgi:Zn-dependent protease|nr:site-2 protease family protein [Isosphaeraceae bacterium]
MSSSWKIGRVAGIPIYVHWTFFILIAFVVFGHWRAGHDLATTAEGVGFVLALFGCVVLHELGHALAARQFGVPTADITLLPIGGIARLQRIPEHPGQELVIALAGPAVNMVIAGALFLAGVVMPIAFNDPNHLVNDRFLPKLLEVNVFLFLFNLLPAFPMDGGRVLRALLAMRFEYARATRMAASVGQFMAILFAFMGLMGQPMLILIALFVWVGAEAEAVQVQERTVLKGVKVRDAMLTDYRTLSPDDTLGQAARLLLAGSQHDFPVLSDGRPVGLLARSDLMTGLAQGGRDALVADFQRPEIGEVEAGAPLVPAMARLRQGEGPCLQVMDAGLPVGLLTLENIGEYLMVRSALAGAASDERLKLADTYVS